MANFQIANARTKANEGGLANNPNDKGALTFMGIASKFWPAWEGWPRVRVALQSTNNDIHKANAILMVDQLIQAMVDKFYKANFWDVYNLDKVNNQAIANEMYDTGVNMGIAVEGKFLQRALNVLNRGGKLYPNLVVDGNVGPATINALNNHPDPALVLKVLNILQGARYISIMEADETQEVFANSWFSRVSFNN